MRATSNSWQQIATCTTSSGEAFCTTKLPGIFRQLVWEVCEPKGWVEELQLRCKTLRSHQVALRYKMQATAQFLWMIMLFSLCRETCSQCTRLLELDKSHYTRVNGYVLQVFIAVIIPAKRMESPSFFSRRFLLCNTSLHQFGPPSSFFFLAFAKSFLSNIACLISGSLSTKLHLDIIMANKEWHDHTSSCWLQVWVVDNIAKGTVTRFLFFLNLLLLSFNSLAAERHVAICAANYTPRMVSSVFWHVSRWLNEPGKSLKHVFQQICMTMYGCAWFCMIMYDYEKFCMIMYQQCRTRRWRKFQE